MYSSLDRDSSRHNVRVAINKQTKNAYGNAQISGGKQIVLNENLGQES